jgi:hypothetical protein
MATTVSSFSAIDDNEVDTESPITESLMTRLRDNSYWIDPASTRTSATSNTLVLTPDTTAGTTQWQEISDLDVIDGTSGTLATSTSTSWATITSATSGYLILDYTFENSNSHRSWGNIKVNLSDDSFVANYSTSATSNGGVFSGTITTSSNVGYIMNSSGSDVLFTFRRDSGNLQWKSTIAISGMGASWIIL